jgi:hypothetical protein
MDPEKKKSWSDYENDYYNESTENEKTNEVSGEVSGEVSITNKVCSDISNESKNGGILVGRPIYNVHTKFIKFNETSEVSEASSEANGSNETKVLVDEQMNNPWKNELHSEKPSYGEKSSYNENCSYGIKCNNYYCDKQHPYGRRYKCKFGEKCNRNDCKFLHPKTKMNDCKFGINCTNESCNFEHPKMKTNWINREDRKEIAKHKISQFWEKHPDLKPLNIALIEEGEAETKIGDEKEKLDAVKEQNESEKLKAENNDKQKEGLKGGYPLSHNDCKYCYGAYKHKSQYDCPCKWTLRIGKNNEITDYICQDCKGFEWIRINTSYINCPYDSQGSPYVIKLDQYGTPCKCIHPYGMCPYYNALSFGEKQQ